MEFRIESFKAGKLIKNMAYSKGVIEDKIKEFKNKGIILGFKDTGNIDKEKLSHIIKDIWLDEENFVCVDLEFLETLSGREVKDHILKRKNVVVTPVFTVTDKGKIEKLKLINVSLR